METKTMMLEADYLVIGAGASGMAFVDELIHNIPDVTFIIVDKHAKAGGHWNDAYGFVTLHQPASHYGVNSKQLGEGGKDLATLCEINAYYEHVMKDLLKSGRVKFFPQCEYKGNGVFHSLLAHGLEYKINVSKKTVDATYTAPTVPSTTKPEYDISDGVNLVPVNGLSHNRSAWKRYVIIGGGKTGIDAVLFLLNQSVHPDQITWVIPNDYWLLNRDLLFPDTRFGSTILFLNCILESKNHQELFKKLETVKYFLRLDPNVEPTRMKAGTVNVDELEKLRQIKDIIRKGRIRRIEPTRIIFEGGEEVDTNENTLHVDCSATGSSLYTPQKIFNGNDIILQDIKTDQSAYSAAAIAAIEAYYPDHPEKKNELLKAMIHPLTPSDYMNCFLKDLYNDRNIRNTLGISWYRKTRLHTLYHYSRFDFLRHMIYVALNGSMVVESLEKMAASIEADK